MRSIRLTNFRSLLDTQRIELRPITVLVGANSSGKSSFLRFFPLLRQSMETPTQSPLLWYTDTGYVDFGDFSQAVRRAADPKVIQVELEIPLPGDPTLLTLDEGMVRLSVTLQEQDGKTQVGECVIGCNEDSCRLVFDSSDAVTVFEVNGLDVLVLESGWRQMRAGVHLVPGLSSIGKAGILPTGSRQILDRLQPLMHGRTTDENAERLIRKLHYGTGDSIKAQLRMCQDSAKWKRNIDAMDPAGEPLRTIQSLLLASSIPGILARSSGAVHSYARGVKYLGPFRVAPERFYRQQAIAVHQIEPHGENLAMFLRALSARHLHDLSRFVHEHLGFGLRMKTEGSHVSILIEEDNGNAFNVVDMGYGFSQVLPVVAQAWTMASGFRSSERDVPTTVLAIEQPELHLHPHHQARLADMLTGVVKASRAASRANGGGAGQPSAGPEVLRLRAGRAGMAQPVQVLVETHSEALINRLGELVEAGKLPAADVSVLLFEKDPGSGITTVRQSRYAEDGTLVNWPVGFFAA
jgi:hypothetical protein